MNDAEEKKSENSQDSSTIDLYFTNQDTVLVTWKLSIAYSATTDFLLYQLQVTKKQKKKSGRPSFLINWKYKLIASNK